MAVGSPAPRPGPKATVLEQLVRIRLADGLALLETGKPERRSGAIYMAGYSVECALKYRICRDLGQDRLEPKHYGHGLCWLAEQTGLWSELSRDRAQRDKLAYLETEWNVSMRYERRNYSRDEVLRFLKKAEELTKWLYDTSSPPG